MKDDVTSPVLWRALQEEFGLRSSIIVLGWCAVFGATGGKSHKEMRDRLIASGLKRTSVYDASAKIQRLQDRLCRLGYDPPVALLIDRLNDVGLPSPEKNWD